MKGMALAMLVAIAALGASGVAGPAMAQEAKDKACRMEKQCRWENFKKICVYVKVCR
jgi:ABC-type sugar transport system substrate-binding protein